MIRIQIFRAAPPEKGSDQSVWDLSSDRTMMGRAKQLGGELLGSSGKKDKSEKGSAEMSDTKALKEALKLAKHKGDHRG